MVLIAPAADFTEALMKPRFFLLEAQRAAGAGRGCGWEPSEYDPAGYPITREGLIEDGARAGRCYSDPLPIEVPVRILQGALDDSVPWTHAQELVHAIAGTDVAFTLIKDGDHRLSRPQDLERLIAAVDEVA